MNFTVKDLLYESKKKKKWDRKNDDDDEMDIRTESEEEDYVSERKDREIEMTQRELEMRFWRVIRKIHNIVKYVREKSQHRMT